MKNYDAEKPIDAEEWMDLDEDERAQLVEQYHRKKRIKVPNLRLHVMIHVIVENQLALGDDTPVPNTLTRLMQEGLSRHDAVHAIGSLVAAQMFKLMKGEAKTQDPTAEYYRQLEELTATSWRNSPDN